MIRLILGRTQRGWRSEIGKLSKRSRFLGKTLFGVGVLYCVIRCKEILEKEKEWEQSARSQK
jgi:hypothetical protein